VTWVQRMVVQDEMWAVAMAGRCPYCGWLVETYGRHGHLLRSDGTAGIVMAWLEELIGGGQDGTGRDG
jgi:hypothetical protein